MKNIVNHLLAFSLKMIVSHIFEVHKLKKTPQFYPWAKSAEMPCSDSLSSRYELFHPENKCLCLLNLTRNFRRQQTSSVREHLIRGFSQADELLCSITVAKGQEVEFCTVWILSSQSGQVLPILDVRRFHSEQMERNEGPGKT